MSKSVLRTISSAGLFIVTTVFVLGIVGSPANAGPSAATASAAVSFTTNAGGEWG